MLLILMFTRVRDLVVDPFMGVGSTAVACALTGRRFWGCDIDPGAVHWARVRLRAVMDSFKSGQSKLRMAMTWSQFRAHYFQAADHNLESADRELFAAPVKAVEGQRICEEEFLPELPDAEDIIKRVKNMVKPKTRAGVDGPDGDEDEDSGDEHPGDAESADDGHT